TCVISWSRHGYENASYCISHTGRNPAIHRPTAAPRIPASASGVSTQRSGPKRSRRPAVARNTPPARPTSSPITSTSPSRASSVWSASFTASTRVSSAIAVRARRVDVRMCEEQLGVGRRLGLGGGDAGAQLLLGLGAHRRGPLVAEHARAAQERLVAADALARPLLLDPRGVDVRARVVGGRVRRRAVVDRLDQRRPAAGAGAIDRGARCLVDGEDVEAVDADAGNAVPDRLVGERLGARL